MDVNAREHRGRYTDHQTAKEAKTTLTRARVLLSQFPKWLPVCRGKQFTPWIAGGRVGTGMLFLFAGISLYLDCRRRWLNCLGFCVFVLSWLIPLAPAS
jgi:hypothetical protein